MWFLNFIPDSLLQLFIHGVVALGLIMIVGGAILNQIPFIKAYSRIIPPLGILLLAAGCFFEGGYGVELSYRLKVADMQSKVAASEAKAKENNTVVVTKYKDRIQTIHDTKVVVEEKIKEVEKKIDSECVVDPDAVSLLNEAAKWPGDKK